MNDQGNFREWSQRRERIRKGVEALMESLAVPASLVRERALTAMLDEVIEVEFLELMGIDAERPAWSVWRQDDNGNRFEIERAMNLAAARKRKAELDTGKHKQLYWIDETRTT